MNHVPIAAPQASFSYSSPGTTLQFELAESKICSLQTEPSTGGVIVMVVVILKAQEKLRAASAAPKPTP
jgi:hypothetical protein